LEQDSEQGGVRRVDEAGAVEESAQGAAAEDDAPAQPARFDYGRVLRVAAVALLAAAAALIYLGYNGAAFFVAGLGASAWFLNVRATLIRKHDLVKVGGRNWRPRREVERESEEEEGRGED